MSKYKATRLISLRNMDIEKDDYTTLSNKDLSDLKKLTQQAVDHYNKVLKSPELMKEEAASVKMEFELCKKYTLMDLEEIEKEIESRNKK